MFKSIFQLDFISGSGRATRLLSIGDITGEAMEIPMAQKALNYAPAGALWGLGEGTGDARRTMRVSRRVDHASHAVAAAWCIWYPATMPIGVAGKLRLAVDGGQVWDLMEAVLMVASPRPHVSNNFRTWVSYELTAGRAVPVSGLEHYAGMPISWILETHGTLTGDHNTL